MIFPQQLTILLLERLGAMVLFLVVYVACQIFQLAPTYGEAPVAALPKKSTGALFDLFNQLSLADGARQSGCQVDMIGSAAYTIRLTATVTANRGQIGVHARAGFQVQPLMALFGAEDNMEDDLAEGLRAYSM